MNSLGKERSDNPLSPCPAEQLANDFREFFCHTWFVKNCVQELAPVISKMVNSYLNSGIVPDDWKLALVIPLLKNIGLELVFKSFRPVSNLSFVSKTAERSVILQLLEHCNANAPLPSNQSSYHQHSFYGDCAA